MKNARANTSHGLSLCLTCYLKYMLLEILAEEALKGSKPSSTFKAEFFVKVAT